MTPLSDIEKLERLFLLADRPNNAQIRVSQTIAWLNFDRELRNLAPSIIADWKQMREEIERLTKERDEAYERAAQVLEQHRWDWHAEDYAKEIRALKAK